jgi:NTP pyrophosphatase (non-canonical NTP hydrolase)
MINAVDEIMNIAQEECAEVIQMVSKCRRFGIDTIHLKAGLSNRQCLTEEVGDVLAMIDLMVEHGVVTAEGLEAAKQAKFAKLKQWTRIYEA